MKHLLFSLIYMSFVLGQIGCESAFRGTSSDVDSQVGDDDTRLLQRERSPYGAVGILSPLGCTGWFVSKKFFVTNQHCVSYKKTPLPESDPDQFETNFCAQMTISVNFYTDAQTNSSVQYKCKKIHIANQSHDFAVVEIEGEADVEPLRIGSSAVAGMEIIVVGHPNGYAKTISEYEGSSFCRLRDVSFPEGKTARDSPEPRYGPKYEHSIEHNCDTLGGSSGSPIIDRASGSVVALHWDGWRSSPWPHADPNGTESATVSIPDSENPGQLVPFTYKHRQGNVGIRIQDIRSFIRSAAAGNPDLSEVSALFGQ